MILQFNAYGNNTQPDGFGYITGFATDADARKFAEVALNSGDDKVHTAGLNSIRMTSDPSLVVKNVRRSTFINKTLAYRGEPGKGEYAEVNAAMGWCA